MDRRSFLNSSLGALAGGLVLGGYRVKKARAADVGTQSWYKEADVVVVGLGFAGLAAALTAHDLGAKVLCIDKSPIPGGNSITCGGMVFMPTDKQSAVDYYSGMIAGTGNHEEAADFIHSSMNDVPLDMIDVWAEYMVGNRAWLEGQGVVPLDFKPPGEGRTWIAGMVPEFPQMQGSENMTFTMTAPYLMGLQMHRRIMNNLMDKGVEIITECPGKELVQNGNKEVLGIIAERTIQGQKREIAIKARKAVILCTGGFEYNEAMKKSYLGMWPFGAVGGDANEGDGIKMGLAAGADLWHTAATAGIGFGFTPPGQKSGMFSIPLSGRHILVDRFGRRFMNEYQEGFAHNPWLNLRPYNSDKLAFERIPAYWILDKAAIKKGPLGLPLGYGAAKYSWSPDNRKEIQVGWIKVGNTPGELAQKMEFLFTPDKLEATVNQYNQMCRSGYDPDYGRPKVSLYPIEHPPFYAMPVYPTMLNTQGGPKRNKNAEVVDPWGRPIPRLYSSGELGSIYGWIYQGGGNVGECLAFGRRAGEQSAALNPWDV